MNGILENDARKLLTACGLKEGTPVPHEVALSWIQFKRCYGRLGGRSDVDWAMAFCAMLHGYGDASQGEPWNAADEWFAKRLKFDDYVSVRWNGATKLAKVKRCKTSRKTITVQFDNDGGERDVPVHAVMPPDPSMVTSGDA